MNLTDNDKDLYRQIVDTFYAIPPSTRWTAHWVMSRDWWDRLDAIETYTAKLPYQSQATMVGRPVKITPDGGEPHLVAEPTVPMHEVPPGHDVIYIQCADPDCPQHKPGMHHAHFDRTEVHAVGTDDR